MQQVVRSNDRGLADHGWLKSRHTFSFADYYNPNFMGFRSLRVINEDLIAPGTGFPKHPHRDMEIISYVVKGSLQHEDTMGNKTTILPGEVQTMSAGTGVLHSEHSSPEVETHLFQIWILPEKRNLTPTYGQRSFAEDLEKKNMVLTVSRDGRDGSIQINQDADMFVGRLKKGEAVEHQLRSGRGAWLQIVRGEISSGGERLVAGDALAIGREGPIQIRADEESEFLLFDLA